MVCFDLWLSSQAVVNAESKQSIQFPKKERKMVYLCH